MSDKDIQKMLDENQEVSGLSDLEEYRELYDYLDSAKEHQPKMPGFAHRVTAKIEAEKSNDPFRRWAIALIAMLVISGTGAMVFLALKANITIPEVGGLNLLFALMIALAFVLGSRFIELRNRKDPFTD